MRHDIFEKKLREKVVQTTIDSKKDSNGGYGVILDYNPMNNTATVLLSEPDTNQTGEVVREVICPTNIGIQMAAPEAGRPCWVVFRGDNHLMPIITHYFNHKYDYYDFVRQGRAIINTPRYLVTM